MVLADYRLQMRDRAHKLVHGGAAQVLLFLFALILYFFCRGLTAGSGAIAIAHAHAVHRLEASVGVDVEVNLQRLFLRTWMIWVWSHIYLIAQFIATPLVLIALYRWRRRIYCRLRNVLLIGWTLALPVYALYPCAPPRLADLGVVDTVSEQTAVSLHSSSALSFYNQYAAIPSMHVAFAIAVAAFGFAALARWQYLRWLVWLWPPLVLLAVVVTGNHFFFDAGVGVVVIAVAYALDRVQLLLARSSKAG